MRKSTVNKIKLEESRSKSNPRDNNLRDSSPSFDKNSSKNHKNQRIIDAKQFVKIFYNISSNIKKEVEEYSIKNK